MRELSGEPEWRRPEETWRASSGLREVSAPDAVV